MAQSEAATKIQTFWNSRYGEKGYTYGTEPNDFLASAVANHIPASLPASGNADALFVGDGEGRNGVWMATQGFKVTSVDLSDIGMAKAAALAKERGTSITTHVADLSTFDLGEGKWDVIVSIFCHMP